MVLTRTMFCASLPCLPFETAYIDNKKRAWDPNMHFSDTTYSVLFLYHLNAYQETELEMPTIINVQLNICFIKHNISWIATLPIEGQKLPFLPFFFFTVKNEKDVLQHAFISKFWRCSHHMRILEQTKLLIMSGWLRFTVVS